MKFKTIQNPANSVNREEAESKLSQWWYILACKKCIV